MPSPPSQSDSYPLWVCDACGHWHGASYNTWPDDQPPRCKIRGYGQDAKRSCGAVMRRVMTTPTEAFLHDLLRSEPLNYTGELAEKIARGADNPAPLRGTIAPIEEPGS